MTHRRLLNGAILFERHQEIWQADQFSQLLLRNERVLLIVEYL